MRPYAERRAARIERLQERAKNLAREGESRIATADARAAVIPFGQPILVGHHSERRDRNYREKIRNGLTKGYEAIKASQELERRAAVAEANTAISSDDPEAVTRLKEKLAVLCGQREQYKAIKAINAAIRAADRKAKKVGADAAATTALRVAALGEIAVSEKLALQLVTPDFCGRIGVAAYQLTNLGAEIRRCEARIATLTRRDEAPEHEPETYGDIRVEESKEDNRVRLYFPGKPPEETRTTLKSHGFRFSFTEGAWQRQAGPGAWRNAVELAKFFTGSP